MFRNIGTEQDSLHKTDKNVYKIMNKNPNLLIPPLE